LTNSVGDRATGFTMSFLLILSLSVEEIDEAGSLGHERPGEGLPDSLDSGNKSSNLGGDGGDLIILLRDIVVQLVDVPCTSGSVVLEAGFSELEKFLLGVKRDPDLFLDGTDLSLHNTSSGVDIIGQLLLDLLHEAHCLVEVLMSTIGRVLLEDSLDSGQSMLSGFSLGNIELSQFSCQLDR
jgi:hypothetical protein